MAAEAAKGGVKRPRAAKRRVLHNQNAALLGRNPKNAQRPGAGARTLITLHWIGERRQPVLRLPPAQPTWKA